MAMTRDKSSFTPGTPLPDHWFHIRLALADDNRHGLGIIQEATAQTKAEADRHARLVNAARAKRVLRKDP
jgi:hypothetical protein